MKYDYGLKPLKFWCQKVLPLVYDESLSYEELLCKVVAYLNEVIEGFNGIPEYIESLVSDEKLKEILSDLINELEEQIASWNEQENENATKDMSDGELVWLNNKLYQMTRDILAGDKYVIEGGTGVTPNVTKVTVEGLIGNLANLTTTEKDNLVGSINELLTKLNIEKGRINAIINAIGDLDELSTTDKSSVVNSINEVNSKASDNASDIGNVDELTTTDKSNLVNSINEVNGKASDNASDIGNLNNLETTDKESLVNAINEVLTKAENFCVNVKDFGATGDGTTNDYTAINNAITHALTNNISIVYFPNGNYNCGNGTFDIDSSKITLLGGETAKLLSRGLTSGAFITITSPINGGMGAFARIPLFNLSVEGDTFDDTSNTGVIGVKMGTDATFLSPHCALYNVTITKFAIGLSLSSAYKSQYFDVSVIACNIGIYVPEEGIQQAVPCTFVSCYVECCNMGLYAKAGSYNSLIFYGGAFEYNRTAINTKTKLCFYGTRFEWDVLASCTPQLQPRYMITSSATATHGTTIKFFGCFFLGLNNFEYNVPYWIPNPYKMQSYDGSVFYCTGGTNVSLEMYGCEIVDVHDPSGTYYIACDKFHGDGNYTNGSIANIIGTASTSQTNGFIS